MFPIQKKFFMRLLVLLFLTTSFSAMAQNDLLEELEKNDVTENENTIATFKGTRIVNGHSIETKPGGTLEFIFSHRFGAMNTGWYEMFGLDQAFVRIGLDYGITDRLSVSLGRNSINKTLDWYAKYKFLQQQSGPRTIPFTITGLAGVAFRLEPKRNSDVVPAIETTDRLAYTGQLLIARKFTSALSLQLMPTVIHKNLVNQDFEENTQIALGVGGRIKLTPSMAFTGEYYHNLSRLDDSPYHNSLGLGIDIETGGHVFQLVFTNAIGLTERAFITETTDDFFDGDIHFGFNVTRTFQFKKTE
jgi:hypothetical protein